MEEIIALDGDGAFGLLTRAQGARDGRVVVLFNAGLVHRVGPQRLHVDLARALAARGVDVFRFDLPGIGDARMDGAAVPREVASRVFDRLQAETGATGFIVGGICSAADLGWQVAAADARVRGLLLIDPMAVRGAWYRIGRLRMALRAPPWQWPANLLRRLRPAPRVDAVPEASVEDYRDWPAPEAFRVQAAALLERGTGVLALYTGGVADYLLHPGQIDDTFGPARRHPGLRVEFRPALDHIFYALRDRREVVRLVVDWVATRPH